MVPMELALSPPKRRIRRVRSDARRKLTHDEGAAPLALLILASGTERKPLGVSALIWSSAARTRSVGLIKPTAILFKLRMGKRLWEKPQVQARTAESSFPEKVNGCSQLGETVRGTESEVS